MVITMKIKFLIPTVDDSDGTHNTSFLMRSSIDKRQFRYPSPNRIGEIVIKVDKPNIASRSSKKLDPMAESIASTISERLIPRMPKGRSQWAYRDSKKFDKFTLFITFRNNDGDSIIWIQKNNGSFSLNSEKMNKSDVCKAVGKIIYKSCFTRSSEELDSYIEKCVKLPSNITYVLENRTPYDFYEFGGKIEVRINTKLISETHAALEISEGIWAKISIKDLNTFVNTYANKSSRSKKWHRIAPPTLWATLLGEDPSESQLKLMIAWLKQNRTSKMVEERAKELLFDLEKEYKNMFVVEHENYMALFVRGEQVDWLIADANRGLNARHQKVNTFYWSGVEHGWHGPICIDNLHSNSSIGDQLAARGLMLKNDTHAAKMIYTLRTLAPIKEGWLGKIRFDVQKLNRIDKDWVRRPDF